MEAFKLGETVIRHGDVLLKKDNTEINGPIVAQCILHQGQNHHHRLSGEFRIQSNENGNKYLEVIKPTELSHDEHRTLLLPIGVYLVEIQREYDHWLEESRMVID